MTFFNARNKNRLQQNVGDDAEAFRGLGDPEGRQSKCGGTPLVTPITFTWGFSVHWDYAYTHAGLRARRLPLAYPSGAEAGKPTSKVIHHVSRSRCGAA